jgi:hypothetical protein
MAKIGAKILPARQFKGLRWLTALTARIGNKSVSGVMANSLRPPLPPSPHQRRRRRGPKPDRRRALELLAGSRDGCTEAILIAHGFGAPLMVELVRAGLATATAERVVAGKQKIEVARVRITEAGRAALAKTAS